MTTQRFHLNRDIGGIFCMSIKEVIRKILLEVQANEPALYCQDANAIFRFDSI
jgi:hypothetical protein